MSHLVAPIALVALGAILNNNAIQMFGFGILATLLWSNMRAHAPQYRWREGPADPAEWNADTGGDADDA